MMIYSYKLYRLVKAGVLKAKNKAEKGFNLK